ncbi:hypothetical protein PV326_013552, partial [Microctonus aethiopoides]
MASSILIFCAISFILVQINFANGVNNGTPVLYQKNATNVLSPSESGRSKRSLIDKMPFLLKIDVFISQELNSLTWHKSESNYLANKYLPVDIPLDENHRIDNIMEDVGDFVLYHDQKKHSAVVYFEKSKTFFGVIGTDYYIQNLPYNFDENYKYREALTENEYLKKRATPLIQNLPDMGFPTTSDTNIYETSELNRNNKRPSDSEAGPSDKHQRTEQNIDPNHLAEYAHDIDIDVFNIRKRRDSSSLQKYFLESLIFVCRDIVDIFKKEHGDDYLVWINLIPLTFINHGELQYPEIVSKLPQYLETNSFHYPPDSFDHVFIFTSRTILNKETPIQ